MGLRGDFQQTGHVASGVLTKFCFFGLFVTVKIYIYVLFNFVYVYYIKERGRKEGREERRKEEREWMDFDRQV